MVDGWVKGGSKPSHYLLPGSLLVFNAGTSLPLGQNSSRGAGLLSNEFMGASLYATASAKSREEEVGIKVAALQA